MIQLHRLNKSPFFLNHRLFEFFEPMPDSTVITLNNEKKYIVRENAEEIIHLAQEYEKKIFNIQISGNVDKLNSI